MQVQEIEFAVEIKGMEVNKVGRSTVIQPDTCFKKAVIKWYQDKPKQK